MTATDRSLELARAAAVAAENKIATSIDGIDVSDLLPLTDVFVIVSAESERQVGAIVDEVEDRLRDLGVKPLRREGEREGRWVLIDFGDIVVHVQHEDEYVFYDLPRLWRDGHELDLGALGTTQREAAERRGARVAGSAAAVAGPAVRGVGPGAPEAGPGAPEAGPAAAEAGREG